MTIYKIEIRDNYCDEQLYEEFYRQKIEAEKELKYVLSIYTRKYAFEVDGTLEEIKLK